MPHVFEGVTVITPPSLLCTPHREVCSTETFDWSTTGRTTRTLAAAVLSNESFCQFGTEGFEISDVEVSVVRAQYEAVCDSNVK